jgi:hypothetical protein
VSCETVPQSVRTNRIASERLRICPFHVLLVDFDS